uniref:Uncharacterized protein n=1 Tax=Heterorhabditis bacteriophora TaxID=37862 RepID=A0A1I7WEG4_HETBA
MTGYIPIYIPVILAKICSCCVVEKFYCKIKVRYKLSELLHIKLR